MRVILGLLIVGLNLACSYKVHGEFETVNKNAVKRGIQTLRGVKDLNEQLKYYVYTRENQDSPQVVEADVESVIRNVYNPLKPTTISIHGLFSNRDSPENQIIVATKLAVEDCNVIVVDYSAFGFPGIEEGAALTPSIGEAIADFIILLHKHFDAKYEQFHVVGFSLGGQIAGFVGQNVFQKDGHKVQRITALDPAAHVFINTTNPNERLSPDDADFVDVIHTNTDGYGYPLPCGDADYYPNGGAQQPGCDADDWTCSHIRAYALIEEMWAVQNNFISTKCPRQDEMSLKICRWVNVRMGENAHQKGVYFLETNAAYPYAKGSYAFEFL